MGPLPMVASRVSTPLSNSPQFLTHLDTYTNPRGGRLSAEGRQARRKQFFFSKEKYFLASPVCQSLRILVSGAETFIGRVVGRFGDDSCPVALAEDDDLELRANFAQVRLHHGERQRFFHAPAVAAGRSAADQSIALQDRF